MSDNITHDLDLLDDWLAGKGYTEEAGLCLRALTLIHKLQDGVRTTIQERDVLSGENWQLRAKNAKLRAALKPFADLSSHWECDKMPLEPKTIIIDPLPVLYAVKETGDD